MESQAAQVYTTLDKKTREKALSQNKQQLLATIRDSIVGSSEDTLTNTVYGEKPLVYADYTASGKSLSFIEEYIKTQILSVYANTHSMQSGTGKQTVRVREEAR